jgi:hypothetical protein
VFHEHGALHEHQGAVAVALAEGVAIGGAVAVEARVGSSATMPGGP